MAEEKEEVSRPPEAPDIVRRVQFDRVQLIGIPILMLLPILALLGLFGESFAGSSAESPDVALHVNYTSRYRYGLRNPLLITVKNQSPRPLANVTVAINREYIDQFSDVSFTPEAAAVHESAYLIELAEVPPGAQRLVAVELRASEHGRHHGLVTVSVAGVENVQTTFTTIVFP
jgi:hypothetical protein